MTERFFYISWSFATFRVPAALKRVPAGIAESASGKCVCRREMCVPADILGKGGKTMKEKRDLLAGIGLLAAFVLWTVMIRLIDVQPAGPEGTTVGFADFNVWFHQLTGGHMTLYTITDWLGLVPICICLCFAGLGCVQLIRRRSLRRVDPDLILLGIYYVLVIAAYLIFEMIPINYRPVLIKGRLEASYPSSTTLLVLSVMPTLLFQAERRITKPLLRKVTLVFVIVFSGVMVIGRLISGVHWATDIAASILLSAGLFMLYLSAVQFTDRAVHANRSCDGVS